MPHFHHHQSKINVPTAIGQPQAQHADLNILNVDLFAETPQPPDDVVHLRRKASLQPHLAIMINDA